jgi:hypothetical protein
MIPRTALNSTAYIVLVDLSPVNATKLPISNSTHVYLYFKYIHSKRQVIVTTPEFSTMPVPLFMIATLIAVIVYRKKKTL